MADVISLTDADRVLLLLCTSLALPRSDPDVPQPLKLREWNHVADRLRSTPSWGRPESLLQRDRRTIARDLELDEDLAERIERLLRRDAQLTIYLDSLDRMGIWAVTRASASYPRRLRDTLTKKHAPAVLFGAGQCELLETKGIAVVGSRNATEEDVSFAAELGRQCTNAGLTVVSGAARGIDREAMDAALNLGGSAVGVVSDALAKSISHKEWRRAIRDRKLVLITPFHPEDGFTVSRAMKRNKIVYGMARYAIVVTAAEGEGGTWAGATENLKQRWVPLLVQSGPAAAAGNRALIKRGGCPISRDDIENVDPLNDVLDRLVNAAREGTDGTLNHENGTSSRKRRLNGTHTPNGDSTAAKPSMLELPGLDVERRTGAGDAQASPLTTRGSPHQDDPQLNESPVVKPEQAMADSEVLEGIDLYDVVWRHLSEYLQSDRTKDEVAKCFKLEPVQAKRWLDRARTDGRVIKMTKKGKGTTYRLAETVASRLL